MKFRKMLALVFSGKNSWRIPQAGSDRLPDMSDTDLELLARYTRQHSSRPNSMGAGAEDAFAEIVRRHLGLVYSAALRQVRSPQLAEEVTQSAFIDLARGAAQLKPDTILTAWLYQVTRRTAIDVVRREASRQLRERIATEMNAMNATAADWTHIEPLLDEAMHALDDTDRTAVLLRYFENKSLREVGATLGASENAAQKRLARAVERLREFLAKRGVTVGTSGLVVVISANAVQAAPVGLAVTISTAAVLTATTIATTATATVGKAIMTTMQKALVTTALATAVGTGIYETRQASTARNEVQILKQEQTSLAERLDQLTRERDQVSRQLAALQSNNEQARNNISELLRLRAEVTRLQNQARILAGTNGKTNDVTGTSLVEGIRWLPKWKDAGTSSPEAALETYFWAAANMQSDRLKQIMVKENGTNMEPVADLFARREARAESHRWRAASWGGVRIHRSFAMRVPGDGRASFQIESMGPPLEGGTIVPDNLDDPNSFKRIEGERMVPVDVANPPAWNPADALDFNLVKINGEWKLIAPDIVKLSLLDEEHEEVAKMMMKMDPKSAEKLLANPEIPPQTRQAYEVLKARAGK